MSFRKNIILFIVFILFTAGGSSAQTYMNLGTSAVKTAAGNLKLDASTGYLSLNSGGSFYFYTNSTSPYSYNFSTISNEFITTLPTQNYTLVLTTGNTNSHLFTYQQVNSNKGLDISYNNTLQGATIETINLTIQLSGSANISLRFNLNYAALTGIREVKVYNPSTLAWEYLSTSFYTGTGTYTLSLTNIASIINDYYYNLSSGLVELKSQLDGSYHICDEAALRIKYNEEYLSNENELDFTIYYSDRTVALSNSTLKYPVVYKSNWFEIPVSTLNSNGNGIYVLEVKNKKSEISYLRFKYSKPYTGPPIE